MEKRTGAAFQQCHEKVEPEMRESLEQSTEIHGQNNKRARFLFTVFSKILTFTLQRHISHTCSTRHNWRHLFTKTVARSQQRPLPMLFNPQTHYFVPLNSETAL